MGLIELLPLKDALLNAKIRRLDNDSNRIVEKLKQGNAVRNNEEIIRETITCLKAIREINQRITILIRGLRSNLSLHLAAESAEWKRQSWNSSNPEEVALSRELNELINLQNEIKIIKDTIIEKLGVLGVEIIL